MFTIEIERKITEAFRGGELRCRELRLSGEEAEYIRTHFSASVTPMGPESGKSWYEISFQGAEH